MSARRVVYVIGSAAPPIFDIEQLLRLLQDRGWQPCLILTPTAAEWIQASHMSEIAGCPLRVQSRQPGETESLPPANAVLAAPLTFNSTNKWAAGINDTLALGLLNELLGEEIPIVVAPCVKAALRRHPSYVKNFGLLTNCGVILIKQEAAIVKDQNRLTFDWDLVVNTLDSAMRLQ